MRTVHSRRNDHMVAPPIFAIMMSAPMPLAAGWSAPAIQVN
ncbi:MAG: hypothetical protein ACT4PS_19665 [Betaproteobacteria bacterium]